MPLYLLESVCIREGYYQAPHTARTTCIHYVMLGDDAHSYGLLEASVSEVGRINCMEISIKFESLSSFIVHHFISLNHTYQFHYTMFRPTATRLAATARPLVRPQAKAFVSYFLPSQPVAGYENT